ncbi:hypothetical protein [Veronia nyctiphanis]|uniref:hypothetical protein n=1 Tax=Veronia nyctiphanis TaxID=1278244 RepID=UPI001F2A5FF4|nr:hypothetical protein [Veronia nyctiphanis]
MEPDACPFETGFKVLDHFLKQHQTLWREKPFEAERLLWSESYPALCNWLDMQTLSDLAVWKQSPRQLNDVVSEMVSGLDKVNDIIDLPRRRFTKEPKDLGRLSTGIPGRKWSQILAFDQSLEAGGSQWLEWCGGKGYLGRLLAVTRGADVRLWSGKSLFVRLVRNTLINIVCQ